MAKKCGAIIVTCMDFRLQKRIEEFANKNLGERNYDRIAWAGGVADLKGILHQIDLSKKLHDIKRVVLINHEECGAYGEAGTKEKHQEDLQIAKRKVLAKYSDMKVDTYYLYQDWNFEKF